MSRPRQLSDGCTNTAVILLSFSGALLSSFSGGGIESRRAHHQPVTCRVTMQAAGSSMPHAGFTAQRPTQRAATFTLPTHLLAQLGHSTAARVHLQAQRLQLVHAVLQGGEAAKNVGKRQNSGWLVSSASQSAWISTCSQSTWTSQAGPGWQPWQPAQLRPVPATSLQHTQLLTWPLPRPPARAHMHSSSAPWAPAPRSPAFCWFPC